MTTKPILSWEAFTLGRTWEYGAHTITEAEIVSFSASYDPLPMHLDPVLARDSPLGVFCASGIHTLAIGQRFLCDCVLKNTNVIAGGGIDRIRMRTPVVPGDLLQIRVVVGKTWPHKRRNDCAWVKLQIEIWRADGAVVMDYELVVLVGRADSGEHFSHADPE